MLTKDLNRDEHSKAMIQATLKQWNNSPTILKNQADLYENQIKLLKVLEFCVLERAKILERIGEN